MKIKSFTIKNYRSIRSLKIDNLNPINVFFGKNNVGKSNILRGLHLAFYSLRNNEMYLPDTMFHNRNIYKPIEITINLILEEDFFDAEKVSSDLNERIENIRSVVAEEKEIFKESVVNEIGKFIEMSESFKPIRKLHLKIDLDYDEKINSVKVLIKDLESKYQFDYVKYKTLYEKLNNAIKDGVNNERKKSFEDMLSELSLLGIDTDKLRGRYVDPRVIGGEIEYLKEKIIDSSMRIMSAKRGDHDEYELRRKVSYLLDNYTKTVQEQKDKKILEPFLNTFNIVKEYFDKISNNFILISNKEYFNKGPFYYRGGKQVEFFDVERFMGRLASLIESPSKKERELIQKFNSVFSKSYGDLGELEIRKFREGVLAIFDNSFTSLPIENQGLGIQDLFLYLAHMILFDSAIISIEEPEGGLSTKNQRVLRDTILNIYSGSDKQIFISSHSEEFETQNSYVIEMGKEGTTEISRMEDEKEYEEKIDEILIKRKLEEEKENYEAILKEVAEKQIALDVLNYIEKLKDGEKADSQKISKELGYEKKKVEEILKGIIKRKK